MRGTFALGWGVFGVLAIIACGSTNDGGGVAPSCTAGQSIACTGAGGCSGGQVCNPNGTYGACDCSGAPQPEGGSPIDSSTPVDSGTDADAASWSPASLPGLQLWSLGSKVGLGDSGTSVDKWPDQSGHAHDLALKTTPGPTVNATGINGLPALTFVSSGGLLLSASTIDFAMGTDSFAVEVVAKSSGCLPANGAGCSLWGLVPASGTGDSVTVALFNGTTISSSFVGGNADPHMAPYGAGAHVFGFRRFSTTASELRVDGASTPFTLANSFTLSGGGYYFAISTGGTAGSIGPFAGDIAEAVVVHAPSETDVVQLESYLKTKYGL